MKFKVVANAVSYLRCSGLGQVDGDTWACQSAASIRRPGNSEQTIERRKNPFAGLGIAELRRAWPRTITRRCTLRHVVSPLSRAIVVSRVAPQDLPGSRSPTSSAQGYTGMCGPRVRETGGG
jgi:hypothetical protein